MRIVVLGLRGFPNIQGGVEKHCENLYPLIAKQGHQVIVIGRKPYVGSEVYDHKGVTVGYLPCPKNKFLEAFVHTFLGVFAAKKLKADIVHIHAIGPGLFIPLARMLGLKVVMTHHGPDYLRAKWNKVAKIVLKAGERGGCKSANAVITIAQNIAEHIKKMYHREPVVIPNGVNLPVIEESESALGKYGLQRGKYILAVGRFVPEKGFGDLIQAWSTLTPSLSLKGEGGDWKLVIVGDADHEDAFSRELKEKAKGVANVVLTGFLSGKPLAELYSHAGLFVLPSYYEGLPIVLLEAMSYGLPFVLSDIPAHNNLGIESERFFKPGDVQGMASRISTFALRGITLEERKHLRAWVARDYNWETIALKTLEVYKKVLSHG